MPKLIDRTKFKYGSWTPLKYLGNNRWLCRCDCGTEKSVPTVNLTRGASTSCGCVQRTMVKERMTKHGHSKTKLYGVWCAVKRRCYRPYDKEYARYGGRGIKMCNEWLESYENFESWALANGYAEGLQIDRKDNNGNYSPNNCRWVTQEENSNNKSINVMVSYNGTLQPVTKVARQHGLDSKLVRSRLSKGWSLDDALKYKPEIGNNQTLRGV